MIVRALLMSAHSYVPTGNYNHLHLAVEVLEMGGTQRSRLRRVGEREMGNGDVGVNWVSVDENLKTSVMRSSTR